MSLIVSVVVCTYNRASLLEIALESLSNQTVDKNNFEIIVIDNNSTDNTQSVIKQFANKCSNLRNVKEEKQGLSHARNRGYKEANAKYVAYMDDDAKAPDNYLYELFNIISDKKPDVIGGTIHPYYLTEKPKWFSDDFEIRNPYKKDGFVDNGSFISGSNMIFLKSILNKYEGFSPEYGMVGNKLAYGEETVLLKKMSEDDVKIYYSQNLKMLHHVPEFKMSLFYFFGSSYRSIHKEEIDLQGKNSYRKILKNNTIIQNSIFTIIAEELEKVKKEDKNVDEESIIKKIIPMLRQLSGGVKQYCEGTNYGSNKRKIIINDFKYYFMEIRKRLKL